MSSPKLACIFLASGQSARFGSNKLLAPIGDTCMAQLVLQNYAAEYFVQTVVVTRYPFVAICASERGFDVCENQDETFNIAHTISLGINSLNKGIEGCMFSVCDQPYFTAESYKKLVDTFCKNPSKIVAASANGVRQNPVIFPQSLFAELLALEKDTPGSAVIKKHQDILLTVEIPQHELIDIDTKKDLKA